jgi:hypothetical protein
MLAALLLCVLTPAAAQLSLSIDTTKAKTTVDAAFVNYNIDTGSLFNGMDFTDVKFRTLVSALSTGGAWIRIGGTAVDASYYFPDAPYNTGVPNPCASCGSGASAISNAMMSQIIEFMQATGMSLLWDFNGETERDSPLGPWNPALNATPLLDWLESKYAGKIDFAYSIGNEPNLWKNKVSSGQMGKDAVVLKQLLKNYTIGQRVFGPSWAGVDASRAGDFLTEGVKGGLDGYTVHDYPYGGKDCNVSRYFDKTPITEGLAKNLAEVAAVAAATPGAENVLLTLEEVACSSGGGCENVTDRFLAGWAWLT